MKPLRFFAAALTCAAVSTAALALGNGAYYGTNYTVPFAHAYRALGLLGVDRHEAIDRDVHHMAALGLNAFRLHLWDVELSDAEGNLLENDHLELLDYLIAALERKGITVILTAQTNFGNGYPERNTDPNGAFSYDYEKCRVHDTPAAAAAQERYLDALVRHVNPHTGLSYSADPAIIAVEINNEPCHSGSEEEITAYVDRMASALRRAGWDKDILYNVSHNLWRTPAFYRADIDGTTYQWYPSGLVHGSTRHGNFLPVLDSYDIPFDTVPGFAERSKVIYEFDPADVLDTYLFPAAARSFRKAGFEWATQFAYDPIDMARFNTEYQTHYLNTAYTPGKAIGMAVAAEVMRRLPLGADYGKYPADTVFGPCREFLVSARRNLAILNDGTHYYNTNSTTEAPRRHTALTTVKGVGSSPVVKTDGTGAYFLDRLADGKWRLELMPDVFITTDPFARPSLRRTVADIIDSPVEMTLDLLGLPEDFFYAGRSSGRANGGKATFLPGVYVLAARDFDVAGVADARLDEYAMPPLTPVGLKVLHKAALRVAPGSIEMEATVLSDAPVDSVVLYPADVDFWREDNRTYPMVKTGKYTYSATVDPTGIKDGLYGYYIVVFGGKGTTTFPGELPGTPLSWDFGAGTAAVPYSVTVAPAEAPFVIFDASRGLDGTELAMVPETWSGISLSHLRRSPMAADAVRLSMTAEAPALEAIVATKYAGDIMEAHSDLGAGRRLCLRLGDVEGTDSLTVTLTDVDGFSYAATVPAASGSTIRLSESDFAPTRTMLNPCPYPSFMGRFFTPDPADVPAPAFGRTRTFSWGKDNPATPFAVEVTGIWFE